MKKIITSIGAVLFLLVIYIFVYHSTDSIIIDFENCIRNENVTNELKNTELYKYYGDHGDIIFESSIDVKRCFVLHNFKQGSMFVEYSFQCYDHNGICVKGASNVKAKWHIKKIDNQWIVDKIKEEP